MASFNLWPSRSLNSTKPHTSSESYRIQKSRKPRVYAGTIGDYMKENVYLLGKEIGSGATSKVYQIHQELPNGELKSDIALKEIDTKAASKTFVKYFLDRELSIILLLKHPHIVETYDIVEIGHRKFIFMQYCANGDLVSYMRKRGRFTELRARLYFIQLACAISYLHNLKWAHRDIKCENILVDSETNILLGDFGFSRKCVDEKGKACLSDTFCGSTAYIPPELIRKDKYDPFKFDIWSMGCVLFAMVAGKLPFREDYDNQQLNLRLTRGYVFPERVSISDECKNLIHMLLEPDSALRPNIDDVSKHEFIIGKLKMIAECGVPTVADVEPHEHLTQDETSEQDEDEEEIKDGNQSDESHDIKDDTLDTTFADGNNGIRNEISIISLEDESEQSELADIDAHNYNII